MLDRFEIRGYRSCIDTEFDIQPDLTVLIGPNGSGKTNVLNAILLLRKLSEERNSPYYRDEEPATDECQIKAWFKHNDGNAILTANVALYTDESNSDVVVNDTQSWYAKDFTKSASQINTPLWLTEYLQVETLSSVRGRIMRQRMIQEGMDLDIPGDFRAPLMTIAHFVKGMKYYSASQFTNPSHCPVSFEIAKEGTVSRGVRLGGHSRFLFDLYREYKERDKSEFDKFFNVIGPDGIGLVTAIDFKEIPTSSIDYSVRSGGRVQQRRREKILLIPQFIIGRNTLSPSQLSEGTFKTITLLFYLMTEQSSALLIEEPEVCVHHGLLSSIVELIKTYSNTKQIILSTHSDFVLDQLEPSHVYKVSRDVEAGTTVAQVTKTMSTEEIGALKHYLETEGNLGEYWRHGGLE